MLYSIKIEMMLGQQYMFFIFAQSVLPKTPHIPQMATLLIS
jgi:hypothetical protein